MNYIQEEKNYARRIFSEGIEILRRFDNDIEGLDADDVRFNYWYKRNVTRHIVEGYKGCIRCMELVIRHANERIKIAREQGKQSYEDVIDGKISIHELLGLISWTKQRKIAVLTRYFIKAIEKCDGIRYLDEEEASWFLELKHVYGNTEATTMEL